MRSCARKTVITREEMALVFESLAHCVPISRIANRIGYDHKTIQRGIKLAERYGMEACR